MPDADLQIGSRRYTGSKRALLNDIYTAVEPYAKPGAVFADLFAGTGVVSALMLSRGLNVIVNDILLSNYVAYQAWFGDGTFDLTKLKRQVAEWNALDAATLADNYFSETYGGKYYSLNDAKKIGYLRDQLEELPLTEREHSILLAALMYAADKIANTVGHFEHFLSAAPHDRGVTLRLPAIENFSGTASLYATDANELVRTISCDIAYIDPPYNARQYVNFYHVLENLVRWQKPTEFEGTSMKFKRNELKSEYSRAKAPQVFADLIEHLSAKLIVVSYNNTYSARSSASNNKISEQQLMDILSAKGTVTRTEIAHKSFNSGKTNFVNHKEFLYICKTYDAA